MKISEVIRALESLANPRLQESYDNATLLTGNSGQDCNGILVSLDVTEDIVQEAVEKGCNLIVAHHPVIFKGLKSLTGKNYVERTIIRAIKEDVAIYAIHTNLDNVSHGVNSQLASRLGLVNCRVLAEKENILKKLETFVPVSHLDQVRDALFDAGAGTIGKYDQCSFNTEGKGTFRPLPGADPFSGKVDERFDAEEIKIELIFPFYLESKVVASLRKSHPYEEVAFYITSLNNTEKNTGSGMIGELGTPVAESTFLKTLKNVLNTPVLRHTGLTDKLINKVAFCGGSGFFLLQRAIAAGADVYITGDIKYHEFFDADGRILLVDAGHYETEQFTIELLAEYLQNKFRNFAVLKTERQTNPVRFFTG